jgi:hypothetical protein
MGMTSGCIAFHENNSAHAARTNIIFTVASTECEISAAKRRNSAQRCANPKWLRHLASEMLRKVVHRTQKLFLELQSAAPSG